MEQQNAVTNSSSSILDRDCELKMKELKLKERELEVRQAELVLNEKKRLSVSPVSATIMVGVIGALAAMFGNWWQGGVSSKLEQQKFESDKAIEQKKFESALMLKALEPADEDARRKFLVFLVDAGLIKDQENKIQNLTNNKRYSLPDLSGVPAAPPILPVGAWGIALQSDSTLAEAKRNVSIMAKSNGFNDAYVFKRPEGYRTVAVFKTENEAKQNIAKARSINPTVSDEPKNIDKDWCSKPQWIEEQQYFDCGE